jgi:hypothetical protein
VRRQECFCRWVISDACCQKRINAVGGGLVAVGNCAIVSMPENESAPQLDQTMIRFVPLKAGAICEISYPKLEIAIRASFLVASGENLMIFGSG